MACVIAVAVPVTVTDRSVELGNMSLATWMDAPVDYQQQYQQRLQHWSNIVKYATDWYDLLAWYTNILI